MEIGGGESGGAGVEYREDLLDKNGNDYCKGGAEVTLKKI